MINKTKAITNYYTSIAEESKSISLHRAEQWTPEN
jgi:hypothetical protein